jgi:hypothetical protein
LAFTVSSAGVRANAGKAVRAVAFEVPCSVVRLIYQGPQLQSVRDDPQAEMTKKRKNPKAASWGSGFLINILYNYLGLAVGTTTARSPQVSAKVKWQVESVSPSAMSESRSQRGS